jgi:hypothetical protein
MIHSRVLKRKDNQQLPGRASREQQKKREFIPIPELSDDESENRSPLMRAESTK